MNLESMIQVFSAENAVSFHLSFHMPPGYEGANGTYDFVKNTLFLNRDAIGTATLDEAHFYVYHELRHVLQYQKPEMFSKEIQESLPYVILYDGTCFKLTHGEWAHCKLTDPRVDFRHAYLSLPYEMDANRFAYDMALKSSPEGDIAFLNRLLSFWLPSSPMPYSRLKEVFSMIDTALVRA